MNVPSPELIIPDGGDYLWQWYHDISGMIARISDGFCRPIAPSEYLAWANISDLIVWPQEYAILRAMDASFCAETNKELVAYHKRLRETGPGNNNG